MPTEASTPSRAGVNSIPFAKTTFTHLHILTGGPDGGANSR